MLLHIIISVESFQTPFFLFNVNLTSIPTYIYCLPVCGEAHSKQESHLVAFTHCRFISVQINTPINQNSWWTINRLRHKGGTFLTTNNVGHVATINYGLNSPAEVQTNKDYEEWRRVWRDLSLTWVLTSVFEKNLL